MRISLRDLFWLVLLVAIGVTWMVERKQILRAFAAENAHPQPYIQRPPESDVNQELATRLQKLSDNELLAELRHIKEFRAFDEYLLEMSRRRMADELREIYDDAKKALSDDPNDPPNTPRRIWDNRLMLTALRRAEGSCDPIRVEIESVGKDATGRQVVAPLVVPRITNVDAGQEPFYFNLFEPEERWRIRLTSASGSKIPELDRQQFDYYEGSYSVGMLRYGKHDPANDVLDARNYIDTPPPGYYTLELHHGYSITGYDEWFIWRSDPVPVVVEDLSLSSKWQSLAVPCVILVAVGLIAGLSLFRRGQWRNLSPGGSYPNRRDVLVLGMIAFLAAGWGFDAFALKHQFVQRGHSPRANWTMRLAK